MEAVFRVNSCPDDWQVIYATCTLMDSALAWWIDHATAVRFDVAYAIDWKAFKQLMIKTYCSQQEIQALKQELGKLTMKGSEVTAYTSRFDELANLCPGMVNSESKKTERYIWGLAPPIRGMVATSRPTTFDNAKQLAYQFNKQCIRQDAMALPTEQNQKESTKRKIQENSGGNAKHHKSSPEPIAVYAAITNTRAPSQGYIGKAPLCNRCNFHHTGNCLSCDNCKGKGHTSRYCKRAPASANATTTPAAGINRTCYECHLPGHFKRDCPNLRN